MRTRKIEVEVYEPDKGKILEVFHDEYDFPIYYDRVYSLFIRETDVVREIDRKEVESNPKGGC